MDNHRTPAEGDTRCLSMLCHDLTGQRYNDVCKRCNEQFSNTCQDNDYCCVCAVRIVREEWDANQTWTKSEA